MHVAAKRCVSRAATSHVLLSLTCLPHCACRVFYKHRDNNFFPPFAYVLTLVLTQLPQSTIECTIFSLGVYWMSGLTRTASNYFLYLLVIWSISNGAGGRAGGAAVHAVHGRCLCGTPEHLLRAAPFVLLQQRNPVLGPPLRSHGSLLPPDRLLRPLHGGGQCGRRRGEGAAVQGATLPLLRPLAASTRCCSLGRRVQALLFLMVTNGFSIVRWGGQARRLTQP